MADIANRAKEVAKEDAERLRVLAQDAFESRAYLYPIKVYNFTIQAMSKLKFPGSLLLRLPQRSLAPNVVQTRPHIDNSNWRNNSNVRLDIRASSCRPRPLQRTTCLRIHDHAGPIREFNFDKRHHKDILHRRRPPRHL